MAICWKLGWKSQPIIFMAAPFVRVLVLCKLKLTRPSLGAVVVMKSSRATERSAARVPHPCRPVFGRQGGCLTLPTDNRPSATDSLEQIRPRLGALAVLRAVHPRDPDRAHDLAVDEQRNPAFRRNNSRQPESTKILASASQR